MEGSLHLNTSGLTIKFCENYDIKLFEEINIKPLEIFWKGALGKVIKEMATKNKEIIAVVKLIGSIVNGFNLIEMAVPNI